MKRLRPPVIKAEGVTPSERYLSRLCEKSFLNLWSYPNPFRDQKQGGRGDGKEVCDLLVVCSPYIIIFSEKTVSWPSGDLHVAWTRWAKRAIQGAAKQAKGAERWITEFPNKLFLDRACKERFPISLPSAEDRIVHRVVVARGAAQSCKEHIPGSLGSLIIRPDIKGNAHWPNDSEQVMPFAIGDIDPSGSFVHVLNEPSLEVIMHELDTIGDFVDYLDKKAKFIRSGRLLEAEGEENLLAYYAIRINEKGEHDFVNTADTFKIDSSHYARFINDAQYVTKKEADRISYLWDELIKTFTGHMLDGTSVTLGNFKFKLEKNELGVRYMALERRFLRRSHAEAVKGALEVGVTKDMFFRMMNRPKEAIGNENAFFILTFRYKGSSFGGQDYEQYRMDRTNAAHIYANGILERYPYLKRVIGIACEPPGQPHGMSEDMIYAEQAPWTEDERHAIRADCNKLGILRDDMTSRRWPGQEFPDVEPTIIRAALHREAVPTLNRQQRRARAAGRRRKGKLR